VGSNPTRGTETVGARTLNGVVYGRGPRERAVALRAQRWTIAAISRELSVHRSTIRQWLSDPHHALSRATERCWLHGSVCATQAAYAYLLGQYLGDGCLSDLHRTPRLRIMCANTYPAIQSEVVASIAANPRELVRGLIHSDGCRVINRVTVSGRRYSYPRYFFSNESAHILAIFTDALDQLGIEWRANRVNSISIARKASVAALDEFIGPKT
jgi:hypothetical protein